LKSLVGVQAGTIDVIIVENDPMVSFLNRRCVASLPGFRAAETVFPLDWSRLPEERDPNVLFLVELNSISPDPSEALEILLGLGIMRSCLPVTAVDRKDIITRFLEEGVPDYILKPFPTDRLREGLVRFREIRDFLLKLPEPCRQADIDRLWGKIAVPNPLSAVPKGIQLETARLFMNILSETPSEALSVADLSRLTKLSRPTVWRCMEFLTETARVRRSMVYHTKGRPMNCYQAR